VVKIDPQNMEKDCETHLDRRMQIAIQVEYMQQQQQQFKSI
jgi:hypothetical protein